MKCSLLCDAAGAGLWVVAFWDWPWLEERSHLTSRSAPQVQASLFLDVARIPSCALQQRQVNAIVVLSSESRVCPAEVDRLRLRLNQLAKNFDQVDYKVDRLAFDVKGRDLGAAQLVLTLTSTADRVSEVSSALAQIQQQMNAFVVGYAQVNSDVDSDWILVEEPSKLVFRETSSHSLALGLWVVWWWVLAVG